MNALLSRTIRAQCRLLIMGLAGRRLHCGSRPIRNCGSLISISLPSCFPAVITSKPNFMNDLTLHGETRSFLQKLGASRATSGSKRNSFAASSRSDSRFYQSIGVGHLFWMGPRCDRSEENRGEETLLTSLDAIHLLSDTIIANDQRV